MAQRVNVILVDDLDGDDAAETVSFGLDGVEYEIDLNENNAAELRQALGRYIEAGRRVAGRKASGRRRGQRIAAGGDTGPSASDIRAWARDNGWDVPERGRVSAEVREAYAAAH
ncbi:histone-like nucleoid-structuring protein Lsr2 [Nocardioides pakistanensis]